MFKVVCVQLYQMAFHIMYIHQSCICPSVCLSLHLFIFICVCFCMCWCLTLLIRVCIQTPMSGDVFFSTYLLFSQICHRGILFSLVFSLELLILLPHLSGVGIIAMCYHAWFILEEFKKPRVSFTDESSLLTKAHTINLEGTS